MNILIVSEYYAPHLGGLETFCMNLAEGLAIRGHKVYIVTMQLPNTKSFEEINGVKIYRVRVPNKGGRYWFSFLAIPTVWKLVRNCDVVHTTTYTATFPASLTAKLAHKPCVVTVHELFLSLWNDLEDMNSFSAMIHEVLERLVISLPFDKFVSVSRYTRNLLESVGIAREKSEMIYNGVRTDLFNPENGDSNEIRRLLGLSDDFVCLFYGRPGISKGVEYLIQAVPKISKEISRFKLVLILAKEPKKGFKRARNLIGKLDVAGRVVLLDPVPLRELPKYISCADCIIFPSLSEGFGLSVAECCAMKKPVIASSVGAIPEVISGRYILIRPRDTVSIAKAVISVNGKKIKKETPLKIFDWNDTVERYTKVYEGLLNCHRR